MEVFCFEVAHDPSLCDIWSVCSQYSFYVKRSKTDGQFCSVLFSSNRSFQKNVKTYSTSILNSSVLYAFTFFRMRLSKENKTEQNRPSFLLFFLFGFFFMVPQLNFSIIRWTNIQSHMRTQECHSFWHLEAEHLHEHGFFIDSTDESLSKKNFRWTNNFVPS